MQQNKSQWLVNIQNLSFFSSLTSERKHSHLLTKCDECVVFLLWLCLCVCVCVCVYCIHMCNPEYTQQLFTKSMTDICTNFAISNLVSLTSTHSIKFHGSHLFAVHWICASFMHPLHHPSSSIHEFVDLTPFPGWQRTLQKRRVCGVVGWPEKSIIPCERKRTKFEFIIYLWKCSEAKLFDDTERRVWMKWNVDFFFIIFTDMYKLVVWILGGFVGVHYRLS